MNCDDMSMGDSIANKNELSPCEDSVGEEDIDPNEIVDLPKINSDRSRSRKSKFYTQPRDERPKFEPEHIVGVGTDIVDRKAMLHSIEEFKIEKRDLSNKSISISRRGWRAKRPASHDHASYMEDDSSEMNEQNGEISVDIVSDKRRGSTVSPIPSNNSP